MFHVQCPQMTNMNKYIFKDSVCSAICPSLQSLSNIYIYIEMQQSKRGAFIISPFSPNSEIQSVDATNSIIGYLPKLEWPRV